MKYHHLTLLHYIKPHGNNVGAIWLTQCDCGNQTEKLAKEVRRGGIKTCGVKGCIYNRLLHANRNRSTGNTQYPLKCSELYISEASINHARVEYYHSAKERNISFELTKEQVGNLITQDCYYCSAKPRAKTRNGKNITYFANGIDRVNSRIGYYIDNVVPCCTACNTMKMSASKSGFLSKIGRIYELHKQEIQSINSAPQGT